MKKRVINSLAACAVWSAAALGQVPDTLTPIEPANETVAPAETAAPEPDPLIDAVNRLRDQQQGQARSNPLQLVTTPAAPSSGWLYYVKIVGALSLVLGLILLLRLGLQKFGKHTPLLAGQHLGKVLGRVQLARGAALHYVQTGGRILVVGVTNNGINLVAEFDPATFEQRGTGAGAFDADAFLAHLRESSRAMARRGTNDADDDEIAALRGDIARLQEYLQEERRGSKD